MNKSLLLFLFTLSIGIQFSEAKVKSTKALKFACEVVKKEDSSKKAKVEVLVTSEKNFMPKATFFEGNEISATLTIPEDPKKTETIFNITVNNKNVFRTEFTRLKNQDLYHIYQSEFTIICQPE